MTPKQILDSFSETLMQDKRILSAQEQALLRNLIRHASSSSLEPETYAAVNATIAAAVGETVAQRAFAVLGSSVVERIVGSAAAESNPGTFTGLGDPAVLAGESSTPGHPRPPQPTPQPPSPQPRPEDVPVPIPPPGPPGISANKRSFLRGTHLHGTQATAPRSVMTAIQCVVLDEFLSPNELQELTRFTLEHEEDFCTSEVVAHASGEGVVNQECRRSRVFMDLGKQREVILSRVQSALPLVLSRLGMEEFAVADAEAQITASNDGDFFRGHSDDGDPTTASRELTFVYFFHREPRQFSGGELRIYDCQNAQQIGTASYETIVPQQNQIVFFPCCALHEITPVKCPSKLFADSRFTLNGWLRK